MDALVESAHFMYICMYFVFDDIQGKRRKDNKGRAKPVNEEGATTTEGRYDDVYMIDW